MRAEDHAAAGVVRRADGALTSTAGAANTYDLIDNKALVLTEAALKYIEEVLA